MNGDVQMEGLIFQSDWFIGVVRNEYVQARVLTRCGRLLVEREPNLNR